MSFLRHFGQVNVHSIGSNPSVMKILQNICNNYKKANITYLLNQLFDNKCPKLYDRLFDIIRGYDTSETNHHHYHDDETANDFDKSP